MKKCKYTINIGDKQLSFTGEQALDNYLLENFDTLLKEIKNKNTLFSFDKTNLDKIESGLTEAKKNLNKVRKEALAKYLNIEDNIKYEDGASSVSDWMIEKKLAKPVDTEDYKFNRTAQLKKENPKIKDSEIEELIAHDFASWEYSQQIGRGLHYVMQTIMDTSSKVTAEQVRKRLSNSWTKGYSKNATLEGMSDEALDQFIQYAVSFKKELLKEDVEKIYTEYVVEGEPSSEEKLRGKIDIVVVKKDGSVKIYDLKVSNRRYDDWDIDKKRFARYQVATYKKMLQQLGIESTKISTYIIPVTVNMNSSKLSKKDGKLVIDDSEDVISDLIVYQTDNIVLEVDELKKMNETYKIDSTIQLNTSHIESTINNNYLSKYFPVEYLNNDRFANAQKDQLMKHAKQDANGKWVFFDRNGNIHRCDDREQLEQEIKETIVNSDIYMQETVNNVTEAFKSVLEIVQNNDKYVPLNFNFPNMRHDSRRQEYINILFHKYTYEKGWRVVDNDDLIRLNVIVLVNDTYNKVDFISLTDMNPSAKLELEKGTTLVGNFYKDSEVESDPDILPATKGNIELIKLMEIADYLMQNDLKNYIIDEMIVTNLDHQSSVKPNSLDKIRYNYNILRRKIGRGETTIQRLDPLLRFYHAFLEIQSKLSSVNSRNLNETISGRIREKVSKPITELTPEERQIQLNQLYGLLKDLKARYFFHKEGFKPEESLESALYTEVARAIINLSGIEVDPYNAPKLATWFGDVWSNGGLNRQFLNSTKLNTADTITLIKPIKQALDSTRFNIRSDFFDYKMSTIDHYKKFKNTVTSNKFVNLSEFDYKNLFDTSENGKKYFLLKDPKTDESLTPRQKEFLEWYLQDINSLRFPGMSEEQLRSTGQWLMAGIMKASTASKMANSSTIVGALKSTGFNIIDDIHNRKHQVQESNIQAFDRLNDTNMMEMYNIFQGSNTMESRAQMIENALKERGENNPMALFETNLEIVGDTMHLAYIRQNEYDKILPVIQANLTILRLTSFITNDKDIEKTLEFIANHIKTTVFDESLISSENKQIYSILSHVKRAASMAILGFNVKSGAKEVTVSFATLYTRALANTIFDKNKVGIKDMMHAYTIVWKDAMKQVKTMTKLEALNAIYGITNMSEDELVSRLNYFQGDPMRFSGNMFWCNRAPDYLNRMTILVGYMLKYGCWDAYTFKNNQLVYDWKKDKRFEIYAKYDKIENVPEHLRDQYNYQRALYNTILNKFIEQQYQIKDKNGEKRTISNKDELPQAFTSLEIAGIKQEADILFGYMDNDNKSDLFKTGIFTIVGHFKTYLTAKKTQWFLTRGTYAGGHFEQAKDSDGNLLYMEYNDEGKLLGITTNKTDNPYIVYKGSIMEGMFWSVLDLVYLPIKSIFDPKSRDKAKEAWKDPVKRRNLMIASHELFLYWLIQYLLKLAFEEVKAGELSNSQREFIGFARDVRSELFIAGAIKSGLQFDAPSINYAQNVLNDISDVFDGKMNPGRVFVNNIGLLRPFKPSLYEYLPNPEYEHTAVTDLLS